MTDKVIPIGCVTYLDLPVDMVLDGAKDKLDSVIVLGYDKDGILYMASSSSDVAEKVLMLEMAKLQFLRGCEDG